MRTNAVTLAVIVFSGVVLALQIPRVPWTPIRAAGAVVAGLGYVLLIAARIQLGSSFSLTPQARKLVTTGIYSRIRNPIYVFSALFLAGLAIAIGHPVLLIVLIALVPVQVARARREEKVLSQAFGEQYERYKAKTWF